MSAYLLIDCGATHCNCHILKNNGEVDKIIMPGFSPITQSIEELPVPNTDQKIKEIYFFGTAFEAKFWARAQKKYLKSFPDANISFSNDLEAAALSTLGDSKGYIHIIGTGSASAYWDGQSIVRNKLNLGYLFEDYASGYDIAREIIRYWNEGKLSKIEILKLEEKTTLKTLLNLIYTSKNPKSTLSKYSTLITYLDEKSKLEIFNSRLEQFYIKNIDNLALQIPHYFIGSMAMIMSDVIIEKADKRKIKIGGIIKNTDEGLIEYFKRKIIKSHVK